MVQRKTFQAYRNCDIAIATEQMKDGKWAVVATVRHSTGTAQLNIDLPVQDQRFDSEADAETHGVRMAREWIEQNMPKVA
ncbi:MAG: hypothetical protein HYY95_16930 [Candidatus Rokubacteria bacterium]|nr:hypothetical protein [Candidatus Rokubacteria bacterium]MBI3107223.1 hypothetical protein [Candidatus Rokubacteria bacterium]